MRVSRLYHPEILALSNLVQLTLEKSHYLIQVLRCTVDNEVILFHQPGKEFLGKIIQIENKKKPLVFVQLLEERAVHTESTLSISLIQGLAKSDKMDWIIQKSTELGAVDIYPVITEFSEVKLNAERALSKQQHWQNIAIAAAEQSGRTRVPTVHLPKKIQDCLANLALAPIFCLHPHTPALPLKTVFDTAQTVKNPVLLVGPEGGFSPKEVALFKEYEAAFVTLGPRILRTETAALVMQSLLQHQYGDII